MHFERLSRAFRSTAFRLSAVFAAIFILSYVVVFAVTYWEATNALISQRRGAIEQEFAAMTNRFERGGVEAVKRAIDEESTPRSGFPVFAFMKTADGASFGSVSPGHVKPGWHDYPQVALSSMTAEDSDEHLLAGYAGTLSDGSVFLLGFDRYNIVETQEAIAWAFTWSALAMLVFAIGGGFFVGRRALSRIDLFNEKLREFERGKLDTRLPVRGNADELDELSDSVNRTLARVEGLMESLRQVSSDIAHDLRTPLTRLRQRLEVASANATTADDYAAAIEDALGQADSILVTFSALLRIAQIEAGARRGGFTKVDLKDICMSVASAYRASFEDEGRRLDMEASPGFFINGDKDLLTQTLANLFENVLKHTPGGTAMKVSLGSDGDKIRLSIADNGYGIPDTEWDKVFQRFYRLERSRTTPGNGLGLSLVRAVADLHGARIVRPPHANGFAVALLFDRSS